MTVRGARCGEKAVPWSYTSDSLDIQTAGASECVVSYIARVGGGLLMNEDAAFTIFNTWRWMPSNQSIADRARFDLTLTVPAGMEAVASGNRRSVCTLDDGRTEYEFTGEGEHPAYLFGFAVGVFASADDGYATSIGTSQLREALAPVPEMKRFFERVSGVPYPLHHYQHFILDGAPPQEIAGGTILSTAYIRSVLADPTEDYLLAHELSHEWWGNLVTATDWSHFWLHEGFATFMTAAWKEARWGHEAYEREMALAAVRFREAWQKRQEPLVTSNASSVDRALIYSRGALVLHLLRRFVGTDAFDAAIRRYTKAGASSPVTTDDLRHAFAASSKKPIDAFFQQWTTRAVLPDVRLVFVQNGPSITVAAVQKPPYFVMHLRIVARSDRDETSGTLALNSQNASTTFPAPRGEITSIFVDGADSVLGTILFARSEDLLIAQLRDSDMLNRLGAIADAAASRTTRIEEELTRMAESDPVAAVKRAARSALAEAR